MTDSILSILDKWQAVTDAATAGPWRHVYSSEGSTVATPMSTFVHYGGGYYSHDMRVRIEADHAFAALARNEIAPRSIEALRLAVAGLGHISRSRTSDGEQLASHRYAGEILKRIESILAGGEK